MLRAKLEPDVERWVDQGRARGNVAVSGDHASAGGDEDDLTRLRVLLSIVSTRWARETCGKKRVSRPRGLEMYSLAPGRLSTCTIHVELQ